MRKTTGKITTSSMLHDDSKAMFQPWRNDAFVADEFVQAMSPIQRWAYRTLLQASFTCTERPYLPDDDARLWALAGCESPKQWDSIKNAVRARFMPAGKNLLGQKRVLEDWQRLEATRVARKESARTAGLASAAKRQRYVDDTSVSVSDTSTKSNKGKVRKGKVTKVKGSEGNGSEVIPTAETSKPVPEPPSNKRSKPDKPKLDTDTQVKGVSFSFSPDLTSTDKSKGSGNENQTPCVGNIPQESLEGMLDILSDGLFETGALQKFSHIRDKIEIACKQAIFKFGSFPLTDRLVLARVFNDVMESIVRDGSTWPPGFLIAVKKLREGGDVEMHFQSTRLVIGDVFGGGSALSCSEWKDVLLPYKEQLQRIADTHGVPQDFSQGVDFLRSAIEDCYTDNRDTSAFELVLEKMEERIPVGARGKKS